MKCQSCGAYLNPAWAKCLVCNTPAISKAKLEEHKFSNGEQEAYHKYYEIMVSDKFNMDRKSAEREAMRLVLRAKLGFQVRQPTKMEK